MKGKLLNSTNISLLLAFLGVLFAAFPTYWTYKCRATGVFCEGSAIGPQAIDRNLERVTEKIATDEGRKAFRGLFVKDGGIWPFTYRRDLVARFSGAPDVTIDTFPYSANEAVIYNNDRDHIVAIVRSPSGRHASTIIAYFPSANLAKRIFDLRCEYESGRASPVSVSNLGYLPVERRLIIDVSSPCDRLELSTGQTFDINRRPFRSLGNDRGPFGATVAINFSTTYHVASAHAVHLEDRRAEAIRDVEACKRAYRVLLDKKEGDLWPCKSIQGDDLTIRWRRLEIYRHGAADGLVLSDFDNCDLSYWHLGTDRKSVFVTCGERSLDVSERELRLSEYRSTSIGVRELTYFIKGECSHLAGYEFESAADGRSLNFRLETNCSALEIDGRKFSVSLTPPATKTVAMYRLFRDENGIVVGLSPITPLTTSATSPLKHTR